MFGPKQPQPAYRIILQVGGYRLQHRDTDFLGAPCWSTFKDGTYPTQGLAEEALRTHLYLRREERGQQALNDATGLTFDAVGNPLY